MRRPDWQARLWQELDAAQARPFEYGTHDCVHLAARCADAMLENGDLLARIGALYADMPEARRLLREPGLDVLVTRYLGESVARNLARQGDLCAADLDTGPALGVCVGPRVAFASSPHGVEYLRLDIARCAWRID